MIFQDRHDAGRQLAVALAKYKKHKDSIVLGLARGGVVTAWDIARELELPLNVIVVRKVGAPDNEELALGAITESGEGIFNDHLIGMLGVSSDYLKREVERQKETARKRGALYRGKIPPPAIKGKTVILVDDGIATGASIRAAIKSVRKEHVKKIVLAVPVAAPDSLRLIEKEVDEVVCLYTPIYFEAVGAFYKSFDQTSDEELMGLLQ